jgi:hypothetical protein
MIFKEIFTLAGDLLAEFFAHILKPVLKEGTGQHEWNRPE